jgi:hypothetical protein
MRESLSWFLTKTGDEGTRREPQALLIQTIEQSPDFQVQKNWKLPDGSILKLHHRTQAPIQVQQIQPTRTTISLERVTVPQQTPAGVPVPVTYEWSGPWQQLQSGIVLLTWKGVRSQSTVSKPQLLSLDTNPKSNQRWLHDHAIAMGQLHPKHLRDDQSPATFQVIEQIAMLPLRT